MAQAAAFLDVVEKIYASALDDRMWASALDGMADLLDAVGVSFEIIDKKSGRPVMIELGRRLEMVNSAEYLNYYGEISPRVIRLGQMPAGRVSYDHLIIDDDEIDGDEFYNDCLAPQGLRYFVAGHVLNTSGHAGVIAAQRSPAQGHVGKAEVETVRRLLPHVRQALDLKFRLHDAGLQTDSLLGGLEGLGEAAVIIDRSGAVLCANSAAAEVFSGGDGITVVDRRICFSDKHAATRLEAALSSLPTVAGEADDIGGRNFAVHRPSGRRPYLVAVRPLPTPSATVLTTPGAAIVFIRDPSTFVRLDADLLRESYDLTAAEVDIACAIDIGLSVSELAEQRGVAVSTVRTQLYALMAKLDVRRQTDLIRLLQQYRRPF